MAKVIYKENVNYWVKQLYSIIWSNFFSPLKGRKEINIINPRKKVPFLIDEIINKEAIQLQLTKLNGKSPELERNKTESSFAILISKEDKHIGQRRMRDKEIIDTIFVRGLQNFDKYDILKSYWNQNKRR